MKKEHWLYLVIAILAVWLIASYMQEPEDSTTSPSDDSGLNINEGDEGDSGVDDSPSGADSESEPAPVSGASESSPAGPNKGVMVSTSVPVVAMVSVQDQSAGDMVAIGRVDMTVDGWVVIHEDRDGAPGNILGAQRFDAGSYSGGQVELLRGTVAGGKYYVMLHADDGDKMFDHKLDMPITSGDKGITATFVAK
jgi:hypothetical protein